MAPVLYVLFMGVAIFAAIALLAKYIRAERLVDSSVKNDRLSAADSFVARMEPQDMLKPPVELDQQASKISEGSPAFLDVTGKLLQEMRRILIRLDERWEKISHVTKPVQAFLDMYHAPPLITVAGDFNTGKSTLINAMLGEKLQAMQIRPKLACVTRLKYAGKRRIVIRHMNGEYREYELKPFRMVSVENFVHEDDIMHDVFYVQVELESSLLKQFDIVDTPGFNTGFRRHNDMTAEFIGYADVLVWVFNAEQLANQPDLELFNQYSEHCHTLIVVNMVDKLKLPKGKGAEMVFEQLVADLEKKVERIYFVSARNALTGEAGSLEKSGMPQLTDYVNHHITPNAREIKQIAMLHKLDQFAACLIDVRQKLLATIAPMESRLKSFNDKMSQYETIAGLIDESLNNWDGDCRAQKNYRWFLTNMPRYFCYSGLPDTLAKQGRELAERFRPLEERQSKAEEWLTRLDEAKEAIDKKYVYIMQKHQVDQEAAAAKDNSPHLFSGDGSDRKALAQLTDEWNRQVGEYNNQAIEYNKFVDELNADWDKLFIAVGAFFQQALIPRMEEQAQRASALLIEIDKESQQIRAIEKEYVHLLQELKIFDQELFPRLAVMYSIAKSERTLTAFRGKLKRYERAAWQVTECVGNWNEDCEAGKEWKEALMDIDRYVRGVPGASQLKRQGQDLLSEFGPLEIARLKIQKSALGLETLSDSLDQGLLQIENKYSDYLQTYAAVIDSLARRLFRRDVTRDKRRINNMAEDWQARVAVYNDVTTEYNEYVTQTKERWDQLYAMIREFFQQDIAPRLMDQMNQAAQLLTGVDELLPLVQELEQLHIAQVGDTKNFDPSIFELLAKIDAMMDDSERKEKRLPPGNYQALLQGFARKAGGEVVVDWKKTYARPKLDGLIVKTSFAFSGDRSTAAHRALEVRQTPRV